MGSVITNNIIIYNNLVQNLDLQGRKISIMYYATLLNTVRRNKHITKKLGTVITCVSLVIPQHKGVYQHYIQTTKHRNNQLLQKTNGT